MIDPNATFLPYLEARETEITVVDRGWWSDSNECVFVYEPDVDTESGLQAELLPSVTSSLLEKEDRTPETYWYLVRTNHEPEERVQLGDWRDSGMEVYLASVDDREEFRRAYSGSYTPMEEVEWLDEFSRIFN
ncbi:MAG: hypothetical protein ABEJ64_02455 [Candidatus Nanohaloarchaea archaeon]